MDLKIDPITRDLVIEKGDFVLVDGLDAIRQELDIALHTFLGEWFLDTRIGMPWFQKILGEKPRLSVVLSIFRDAILKVNGILSVTDLNAEVNAAERELTVTFRAISTEGEIEYSKEFII
jgi:hypothetical protein